MDASNPSSPSARPAWNKKLAGPKPPLRLGHVWTIRARLHLERRTRDLALFNLAIDSKLRGCDLVALRVDDVAPNSAGKTNYPGGETTNQFYPLHAAPTQRHAPRTCTSADANRVAQAGQQAGVSSLKEISA